MVDPSHARIILCRESSTTIETKVNMTNIFIKKLLLYKKDWAFYCISADHRRIAISDWLNCSKLTKFVDEASSHCFIILGL